MVKKIILPALLLLIAILIALYGQQRTSQLQTSEPVPITQNEVELQSNVPTPSLEKTMYENNEYGFRFEEVEGFFHNETIHEEPQAGGLVYLIQLGDSETVESNTFTEKGMSLHVVKIDSAFANGSNPLAAPSGMDPASEEDAVIAGERAKLYNSGEVYTVAKNGYEYLFILGTEADQDTKDAFSKIISSFAFTK